MGAKDFLGELMGLGLGDIEVTIWLWIFSTGGSLLGVVGDQVLSEFVDWDDVFLSGVTDESLWDNSGVWLHIASIVVDGTWESIKMWAPSLVGAWSTGGLENLLGLDELIVEESHGFEKFLLVIESMGGSSSN